ncbi:MAG: type II secretion system protein GspG [Candidatus Dependentiae bacterium]|nr:type II secretion system protein GspG [Candidatus Dependentiae bacterium]
MIDIKKTARSGFTLIELMISIAVIVIILGMVIPGAMRLLSKGNRAATQNILKIVDSAIFEFKADVHALPAKLEDLDKRPEGVIGWNGSYLPEKMQGKEVVDGWSQPLVYKVNARGSKKAYELYSNGDPEKEEDRIDAN